MNCVFYVWFSVLTIFSIDKYKHNVEEWKNVANTLKVYEEICYNMTDSNVILRYVNYNCKNSEYGSSC